MAVSRAPGKIKNGKSSKPIIGRRAKNNPAETEAIKYQWISSLELSQAYGWKRKKLAARNISQNGRENRLNLTGLLLKPIRNKRSIAIVMNAYFSGLFFILFLKESIMNKKKIVAIIACPLGKLKLVSSIFSGRVR